MNEKLHAIWTCVTAPFPLFLIIIIVGGALLVGHIERNDRP